MAGEAGAARRRGVCPPSFEPVITWVGVNLPDHLSRWLLLEQRPSFHVRLRHTQPHATGVRTELCLKGIPSLSLSTPASRSSQRHRSLPLIHVVPAPSAPWSPQPCSAPLSAPPPM